MGTEKRGMHPGISPAGARDRYLRGENRTEGFRENTLYGVLAGLNLPAVVRCAPEGEKNEVSCHILAKM
jgi:hypothetical protein